MHIVDEVRLMRNVTENVFFLTKFPLVSLVNLFKLVYAVCIENSVLWMGKRGEGGRRELHYLKCATSYHYAFSGSCNHFWVNRIPMLYVY